MPSVNLIVPDVTLRLDSSGVIKRVAGSTAVQDESLESWVGRSWADTVVPGGGDHVRRVIEDAGASGVSILLQLKQRFPSGRELLMEYTTVRLEEGSDLLAVGKNLHAVAELQAGLREAQREGERHSWQSRDLETRYRLLFDASHEALVLLDAKALTVVEINPAGARDLHLASGDDFLVGVDEREQKRLRGMFKRVRDYGRSPRILLHFGANRSLWGARASLVPAEPEPLLMVQLALVEELRPNNEARAQEQRPSFSVEGLMERLPDAFVVIDGQSVVARANRAFVDLTRAKNENALLGGRLDRWFMQPGAPAADLLAQLRDMRVIQDFETKLRTEDGDEVEVSVTGATSSEGPNQHFGLLIKRIKRKPTGDNQRGLLQDATRKLEEAHGTTSLPNLVRDAADMLERRYIEAALNLSNDNRTAAAELLGISRQSLHLKLNRYALTSGSIDVD
jgi:transcriptional regulator PpsR